MNAPLASAEALETQPMSQFEHMLTYASAKLGQLSTRFSAVLDNVSTMPRPELSSRTKALATALILAPTTGHTVEQAFAQDGATATTPPASPASSIKFYDISDPELGYLFRNGTKHCLAKQMVVDPHSSSSNPTGKRHNKYGRAWISLSPDKQTQKVNIRFKKGYELCFTAVSTLDNEVYFPTKANFHKTPHGRYYIDPFRLDSDQSGLAIGAIHIAFKRSPRKHK